MIVTIEFRTQNVITDRQRARLLEGLPTLHTLDALARRYRAQTHRLDSADPGAEISSVCAQLRAVLTEHGNQVRRITQVQASQTGGGR